MKKIISIFFLILGAYFFWLSDESQAPRDLVEDEEYEEYLELVSPTPSSERRQQVQQQFPTPTLNQIQNLQPALNQKPISGDRNLPPGMVEFVLTQDNWAVTHGDILLGKLQTKIQGNRGTFRPQKSLLWETADIPFGFAQGFPENRVKEIILTLEEISQQTAVNFYIVDSANLPKDYIMFIPSEDKCASYLGRIGGQQPIFLKEDCGPKEIRHEALHALGFVHEQSRKDRDQYVKINWENIKEGFENQFDIVPDVYLEHYRGFVFSFDYESVMLYSPLHFTKSQNLKTIESTTNKEIVPKQDGLSDVDIQRINYLYGNL